MSRQWLKEGCRTYTTGITTCPVSVSRNDVLIITVKLVTYAVAKCLDSG